MKKITQAQKDLQARMIAYGISKPYAHQLATGRRLPSMDLAKRLYRDLGISPMFWMEESKDGK